MSDLAAAPGATYAERLANVVAALEAVQAAVAALGGWSAEADLTFYELGTTPPDTTPPDEEPS